VSIDDSKRRPATGRRVEEGRYTNFFQIGHNAFEFLLEFGQQGGKIHTRLYLSPPHARMLSDLLNDALRKHAKIYGPESIVDPSDDIQ